MKETMIEADVTYTLEHDGQFYLIEDVPARVCREIVEPCFSPQTVEHIQALIKGSQKPVKVIQAPVFNYA